MIGLCLLANAIILLEEKGYLIRLDTIVSVVRSVSKLHKRVDQYLARRWSRAGQTSWTSQARECEEVSRRALREKEETISARNRELEEAIRSDCKEEHEIRQRMAALDVARWRRSPLMAAGTWATQMCSRVLTDSHRRPKSLAVVPTTCSMAMSPPQPLILSFIAQY